MRGNKYSKHGLAAYFIGHLLRALAQVPLFIGGILSPSSVDAVMIMLPVGMVALSALGLLVGMPFLGIIVPLGLLLVGGAGLIVAAPIGSFLSRAGKTLTTKSAEELLKDDSWRPVLYLRSFVDDRVAAKGTSSRATGDFSDNLAQSTYNLLSRFYAPETEEEVLANELSRIGLCVAVGIPNERLPPIGIPRMYFENDDWEQGVQTLMQRSELVVMRAGTTKGFLLELEMAVKYVDPKKLLILLSATDETYFGSDNWRPPDSTDALEKYIEFRVFANTILPKNLPEFRAQSISGSTLAGVIYFQSDWTPKALALLEIGDSLQESIETISKRYSHHGTIS